MSAPVVFARIWNEGTNEFEDVTRDDLLLLRAVSDGGQLPEGVQLGVWDEQTGEPVVPTRVVHSTDQVMRRWRRLVHALAREAA